MTIEGIGEFDGIMYYNDLCHNSRDNYVDALLRDKVTHCFKAGLESQNIDRNTQPLMIRVGYSQKDKDGTEHKIEVEVDTRGQPSKSDSSSNKDNKSSDSNNSQKKDK